MTIICRLSQKEKTSVRGKDPLVPTENIKIALKGKNIYFYTL